MLKKRACAISNFSAKTLSDARKDLAGLKLCLGHGTPNEEYDEVYDLYLKKFPEGLPPRATGEKEKVTKKPNSTGLSSLKKCKTKKEIVGILKEYLSKHPLKKIVLAIKGVKESNLSSGGKVNILSKLDILKKVLESTNDSLRETVVKQAFRKCRSKIKIPIQKKLEEEKPQKTRVRVRQGKKYARRKARRKLNQEISTL